MTLDLMHRKAMRACYHGADVQGATTATLLREVAKIAPDLIMITNPAAGQRKLMYANLTDAGREFLDGKPAPKKVVKAAKANTRQRRFKQRLLKTGGKRTSLNLTGETVGYIASIQKHRPESPVSAIVAEAIALLARKVHNAAKERA